MHSADAPEPAGRAGNAHGHTDGPHHAQPWQTTGAARTHGEPQPGDGPAGTPDGSRPPHDAQTPADGPPEDAAMAREPDHTAHSTDDGRTAPPPNDPPRRGGRAGRLLGRRRTRPDAAPHETGTSAPAAGPASGGPDTGDHPAPTPGAQHTGTTAEAHEAQDAAAGPDASRADGALAARETAAAPADGHRTVRARGADAVRRGLQRSAQSARAGAGHLADRIIDLAPRIPVRDLATLRRQFPGLGPEELADKLIAGAAAATATVGAGVGAAAMLPVPPAMPAELAAEITGVAAIEIKLIAELHEVYGLRPPGTLRQRSLAYLTSWTEERGIDVTKPASVNAAFGGRMKRELRQQIMKRTVRNLPNLMPFLVGAAVGAVMNRRDTRKLAERVRGDLRTRRVPWEALRALPPLEQPADPLDPMGQIPGHQLPGTRKPLALESPGHHDPSPEDA